MEPQNLRLKVDGISKPHQGDSGADVNLWGDNHFRDFCALKGKAPKLLPIDKPIRAANKIEIKCQGYFSATLSSAHATRVSRIYVTVDDSEDPPILSRFDLYNLGYMKFDPDGSYAANRVEQNESDLSDAEFNAAVEAIHKKYHKVFKGIGRYKYHTVDLQLKPDAQPFIIRAIPCPIHLRAKALERLEYFQKYGILVPLPNG